MENKEKELEQQEVEETKNQDINNQEVSKEVEELKAQIAELQILNNNLKQENAKLNLEITKINNEYVTKLTAKSKEAQEQVNKRYQELEEKSKQEVEAKLDRIIESKFDELLKTIEQLAKIVNMPTNSEEVRNYVYGFKMILGMFQNSLAELNIHQIIVNPGEKFDENLMQAFEMVDGSGYESNCVADVISNAYEYKNKIIKHAVVKVQK